jgi:hypothetical protein
MIFGVDFYHDLNEALNAECKQRQQQLRASKAANRPAFWIEKKQEDLDFIAHFTAKLGYDMTPQLLAELAKDAVRIDEIVFKGYSAPAFSKNPAQAKVTEMMKICKQIDRNNIEPVCYVAAKENGKIESTILDGMIEYTAITPQSKNNDRHQFMNDYHRGFDIKSRNLSHLSSPDNSTIAEIKSTIRSFLDIKEPEPGPIHDVKKKLLYDFIVNTGQEAILVFMADIMTNMSYKESNTTGMHSMPRELMFTDNKAMSFNWHKDGDKLLLDVQLDCKILLVGSQEVIVSNPQGEIVKAPIFDDFAPFSARPSLTSHHYQAELHVREQPGSHQFEARLELKQYVVKCHPAITYQPDMKHYHVIEPMKNLGIGDDVKVKAK